MVYLVYAGHVSLKEEPIHPTIFLFFSVPFVISSRSLRTVFVGDSEVSKFDYVCSCNNNEQVLVGKGAVAYILIDALRVTWEGIRKNALARTH